MMEYNCLKIIQGREIWKDVKRESGWGIFRLNRQKFSDSGNTKYHNQIKLDSVFYNEIVEHQGIKIWKITREKNQITYKGNISMRVISLAIIETGKRKDIFSKVSLKGS